MTRTDSAVERLLGQLGGQQLHGYIAADAALAPYRYFIDSKLARTAHTSRCATAGTLLVRPALDNLAASYEASANHLVAAAGKQPRAGEAGFAAQWNPYLEEETRFASLLIPIVNLREGEARLRGFPGAPAAAYFDDHLSSSEVNGTLAAVRASDGYKRYVAVLAAAASLQRNPKTPASRCNCSEAGQPHARVPVSRPMPARPCLEARIAHRAPPAAQV